MVKPNEIAAIASDLWYLPDEQVARVKEIVRDLRREHGLSAPDYDDSDLTDEDKRDIARAAMIRFDREHPDEEWGEDCTAKRNADDAGCNPTDENRIGAQTAQGMNTDINGGPA